MNIKLPHLQPGEKTMIKTIVFPVVTCLALYFLLFGGEDPKPADNGKIKVVNLDQPAKPAPLPATKEEVEALVKKALIETQTAMTREIEAMQARVKAAEEEAKKASETARSEAKKATETAKAEAKKAVVAARKEAAPPAPVAEHADAPVRFADAGAPHGISDEAKMRRKEILAGMPPSEAKGDFSTLPVEALPEERTPSNRFTQKPERDENERTRMLAALSSIEQEMTDYYVHRTRR